MITVTLISNAGDGDTRTVSISEGTTLGDFKEDNNFADSERFSVRVNRRSVPDNTVLLQDDRVSVTPTKVAGADPA